MSTDLVQSVADLEETVGVREPGVMLKSISRFDEHCRALLSRSPYVVVTVFVDGDIRVQGVGGAAVTTPERLELPGLEGPEGAPVGVVVLVPGYGETLRVNGRLGRDGGPHLRLEEAYLHCAKCILRSRLWDDVSESQEEQAYALARGADLDAVAGARELLGRSPFVVIGSVDGSGGADASPKGDPAGFVHVLDATTLAVPDRPGNRRTDTFHNLLEQPQIGLLAVVPGLETVLEVRGTARITRDAELRDRLEAKRNIPKVALLIDVTSVELRTDAALAGLWSAQARVAPGELPRASQIWIDHLASNATDAEAVTEEKLVVAEKELAAGIEIGYQQDIY